ncbi:MAG: oxalate oxidoreductase subunit alpha [Ignavibacteriales bacterium]
MGQKRFITGLVAVAHAVRLADVDVIATFPIRPYTGVMSELTRMVADGELDAEVLHAAGEHDQLAIAYGASASGARTFVGSSGVGVTFAFETYSPISGARLPVQCMIADRTLDPPGDFGSEHTEALSCRDQAWIMGWAENPQEALDMSLLFYRVGEDPRVLLPQFPCQDGYFVSHIPGTVDIPDEAQVKEFLPPYRNHHVLDPRTPMIIGAQIEPTMGPPLQYQRKKAMDEAKKAVEEAYSDFAGIFGRKYDPWIEEYMTGDADAVFFIQGAHSGTAKAVVRRMREMGAKIGLAKLRTFRPFPTEEVRDRLSRFKVVGVVNNDACFGISGGSGVLFSEVRTALYGFGDRVKTIGFVAGLGGEVISHEELYRMAQVMLETARTGVVEKETYWLPFELSA